jgi:hypothetical protein
VLDGRDSSEQFRFKNESMKKTMMWANADRKCRSCQNDESTGLVYITTNDLFVDYPGTCKWILRNRDLAPSYLSNILSTKCRESTVKVAA